MVSLFCRHNRFTADCPICSRGTVLETPQRQRAQRSERGAERGGRPAASPSVRGGPRARAGEAAAAAPPYRGRYGSVGPYERDGTSWEVRLERVPGGLRLGEWSGERLARSAPVLGAGDVLALVEAAGAAGALDEIERSELEAALAANAGGGAEAPSPTSSSSRTGHGASPGRSGELREELRVERLEGERVRVARWVLRPGTGWELLDAPPMLPAARFAEAVRDAVTQGLLP